MSQSSSSSNIGPQDSELDSLLELMAEDRLSLEQEARLEELICTDKEARSRYIEMASLCAELSWVHNGHSEFPSSVDYRMDKEEPVLRPGRSVHPRLPIPVIAFLAGSTAALVLVSLGMFLWPGGTDESAGLAKGSPEIQNADVSDETPPIAATLTGLVDCRWSEDIVAPTYGEQLKHNRQLKIESGLAQLTFESGAKLILQGPVKFMVRSEMKGTLDFGKLTAVVPQQASGFTVSTPSTEVVDLGTEFGMQVDDTGKTEVHVFDGEVLSWQVDDQGSVIGDGLSLTENKGATYTLDPSTLEQGASDPGKFIREVTPRLVDHKLPALPVKRDLALWLAADVLVKKDNEDRVIAWRDILTGDNQMEEDAWQHDEEHRPLWTPDAIGGKPALRFDGKSAFLVTTPLPTTKDQTLFFVFRRSGEPVEPEEKRQLINYNGPPGSLPVTSNSFRILQIGDFKVPGAYRGFVYARIDETHVANLGLVRMKKPAAVGEPLILSYSYNTVANESELIVNGASQGTDTASSGAEFVSRKIIGKHPLEEVYFEGDISELLIYNAGLSKDETSQISSYLSKKYAIEMAD